MAYDNNTFIDWYRESTIHSLVYAKWAVLIATAVASGYLVTMVDLASIWLNDLRKGLCFSRLDKWSLLNPYLTCPADDWYDWSETLFHSTGFIASILVNFPIYIFFGLIYSVLAVYVSLQLPLILQSGIPEVKIIIQGLVFEDFMTVKTLFLKVWGLILVVSSGFWLGKEGPLVHVVCCIMTVLYRLAYGPNDINEGLQRELLSAATATGISLAFNSPIGGVLFVLELIPSYYTPIKIMWNSFISATVSLLVLNGFQLFTEGDDFKEHDLFSIEFGNVSWLVLEIVPFIGLGILGGFYGYFFNKLYVKTNQLRNVIHTKLSSIFSFNPNYSEIVILFLVTSLVNYPFTITRLSLNSVLKLLFTNCTPNDDIESNSTNFICKASDISILLQLAFIAVQAFLLSSYTFGTILPGGVLMPSLVIGAVCGRFIGILSKLIQESLFSNYIDVCTSNGCLVSPASYAVIGAGSFMAGITKLTMCVVVILFELTGALSYVLPIMISVMVLKFTNDYLSKENIYDIWLKHYFNRTKGVQYNEGKGHGIVSFSNLNSKFKNKLPDISIASAMVPFRRVKCLYLQTPYTASLLISLMNDDNHEGYPLVFSSSNPVFLGYVHKQSLFSIISNIESANPISLQVPGLAPELLSQQLRYEQEAVRVDVAVEKPFIKMNDKTSFSLLIDAFEKMYLNYMIVYDSKSSNVMAGFVDRFIVADLIDSGFESVDVELEAFEEEDEPEARPRESIELVL